MGVSKSSFITAIIIMISSIILSGIGFYLCYIIPKPENLRVMWEYLTSNSSLYLVNFIIVSGSLLLFFAFYYGIYSYIKRGISSYDTVYLGLIHFIIVAIYVIFSIYAITTFVKYFILLSLIPAIAYVVLKAWVDNN